MITITAPEYDLDGDFTIQNETIGELHPEFRRRMSYAENLDGTISVTDDGFFYPGHEIVVTAGNITEDGYNRLKYLMKTYNTLFIAVFFGFFECAVTSLRLAGGTVYLKLVMIKDS